MNEADLFPYCPPQRENTITSAPSLMVLVLKPLPSVKIWNENAVKRGIKNYKMKPSIYRGILHCPMVFANLVFSE